MLGLVGIPCYGTINNCLARAYIKLGLVGIPCYGTICGMLASTGISLGLVGIPCYGTILVGLLYIRNTARACRNSLLWYNSERRVRGV